ncbi:choice-of-anchor J domain-containing protein [Marinicella sp. S1101]|uniref:choice-of-anchor J domain-containing protein n=1 Tax=Marinicella marina TaxID=2996016 RepID=UPI002260F7AB|nr:choice-of-anchor J domain-containing protein [Marinicella marina]MCX7552565.1 choice-of-anchor J domain-containing protein [Marinicella marina]MDJ1139441.1 choice-of-anchor J domain-containing protein [Marinicella marina]
MNTYTLLFLMSLTLGDSFFGTALAGEFNEGFEDINQLTSEGWVFDNQSDFIGDLSWNQGFASVFTAHAGPDDSYLLGGAGQTAGNVLCDWVVLPDIGFVEQLNFFTRTESNSIAPDRLVVAYSASGGTNTGPCVVSDVNQAAFGSSDFGDFVPLFTVNPELLPLGYPNEWTEYNVPVNGAGRLALVYFVEDVGQNPFNGNLIAIDSLTTGPGSPPVLGVARPVPSLSVLGLLLVFVLLLFAAKRHHYLQHN